MTPVVFFIAFISIVLAAAAQTLLKMGVSTPLVKAALTDNLGPSSVWIVVTSPWVLAGLFCFGTSVILWLCVLARVPLSIAYPAVALGIVLTVLSGYFVLGEAVSIPQIIGIGLIIGGVACVTFGRA